MSSFTIYKKGDQVQPNPRRKTPPARAMRLMLKREQDLRITSTALSPLVNVRGFEMWTTSLLPRN